jgi:dTDP-4-dehydrorhamnose 3,5-epimerase
MIAGVKIIELTTHGDDRGFFREIFRFPEQFAGVPVGQLSHSQVKNGITKAWHGHIFQSQWNYVVTGQIEVALYDNREDSSTYKELMEFIAGDEAEPISYFFPPGVLHGYKCIQGPMQIIYVTSGIYDLDDEIRNSNKDLNINYKWQ